MKPFFSLASMTFSNAAVVSPWARTAPISGIEIEPAGPTA